MALTHSLSDRSFMWPSISLQSKAPLSPVFKLRTIRGDDGEVPGEIIKKDGDETETVANSGNIPFRWLLKFLTELFVKYTPYALDAKYQSYVKFVNDAMSLVTNTQKIVVIVSKLVGSALKVLESACDGAEAGKTEAEVETGKTKEAAENDKAKVRPKEEDAKRDGSVYVFVFVFGGTAWVMVDSFKD